ncbi:MAG: SMP-30/gluconolactonase/LRE family protein [Nocardiaceae bacterium]|nr:SMP-30/gluconolactonase/LRE family protein [Nocardiaceae bacterium]
MRLNRRLLSTNNWSPPKAPENEGRTELTAQLEVVGRIASGGHGPEDVCFDSGGGVVTGLLDGSIVEIDVDSGVRSLLGNTGGRPLGVQPCTDGSILVADHDRGLLRLRDGQVEVLVDEIEGERLTFASNVVVGSDGTIWFTTSTSRWDVDHHEGDILEHSCTGRLVQLSTDGTVTVLVHGLAFGNGLVLAPDESHLLFAETAGYRISRYWLTGPDAGADELIRENLHGFPDNMSLGSDGLLWVAIVAPRNPLVDRLLSLPGILRTISWNLPRFLRPKPAHVAWVMAFDLDGNPVHDLRLDDGSYGFVTAVAERDGTLVLSSIGEDDLLIARKP